jgi:hypothetical protein
MSQWILAVMIVATLGCGLSIAQTASEHQGIAVSEPIHYARVYTDSQGETHFCDETISFQLVDYAPPAPPISVTEIFAAENISFLSSPASWYGDWHPAPRRQFILVMAGELEVEVSDGEVRCFGPGSFCLVEDTTGKGHISRVVGSEQGLVAAIPLTDD